MMARLQERGRRARHAPADTRLHTRTAAGEGRVRIQSSTPCKQSSRPSTKQNSASKPRASGAKAHFQKNPADAYLELSAPGTERPAVPGIQGLPLPGCKRLRCRYAARLGEGTRSGPRCRRGPAQRVGSLRGPAGSRTPLRQTAAGQQKLWPGVDIKRSQVLALCKPSQGTRESRR